MESLRRLFNEIKLMTPPFRIFNKFWNTVYTRHDERPGISDIKYLINIILETKPAWRRLESLW